MSSVTINQTKSKYIVLVKKIYQECEIDYYFFLFMCLYFNILVIYYFYLFCNIPCFHGDWGLGIGDWGLGIGDWAQSPIPNPQSPIPNPQSPGNIYNNIIHNLYETFIITIPKFGALNNKNNNHISLLTFKQFKY